MNLTGLAIEKNRVTLVLVTLLLGAGVLAYFSLPKEQDPGFVIRTAVVSTMFPGASPERVEQLVTDQIEKKAQEMPEVDSIHSESRTGISIVTVNFLESYKEMRPIFDDLRRKIEDVTGDLPEGIQGPFVNDEFGDVFGSVYTLTGDGYSYAELEDVADEVRDELLKIPEIAKVSLHGTQEEVIFVEYNSSRLADLGLSPQQLSGVLTSVNILSSGGDLVSGRERIVLEPTGNFESVEELRRTVIQLPSGGVVYLGDIARVTRDYVDPPASLARVNGKATLAIGISMRDGGDILKLGEILDRVVPQIQARYPWGIELQKIWFQAELVQANIDGFLSSLLQAIAIVILVMVVTLRLRTGLVVASLIPSAIIITFFVMQILGITINQISLAALIIALGLLVDNAIVLVESVLVKRENGMAAIPAAVESGKELMMPLLSSSLTTAAAFLPIGLAESAVGEYTADIFYVVTITLLVSWVLAMTFVPLLTTVALKIKQKAASSEETFEGRWYRFYRRFLLGSLRHRLLFGLAVIGVFFMALKGLGRVPAVFIAPSEDPVFTGKFEMPLGTSIEASQEVMADLDGFLYREFYRPEAGEPTLNSWLTFIGDGGPRFTLGLDPPNANPANSFLIGKTVTGEVVDELMGKIEAYARDRHPDLQVQIARLENGPPVGYPIQIRIAGPETGPLYQLSSQVTNFLYDLPEVNAVKNTWGLQTKKLVVAVDQERALAAGVTSDDVAYSLKASLTGIDMTEYREGDKLIPVTLRSVAADRQDIGKLDGLSVYSQASGATVPLKQVADTRLVFEPGVIERRDRSRTMTLKVALVPGVTAAEVNAQLSPWLAEASESWPADFSYEEGGEAESSGDANASIAAKLPLAAMFIVLLLVAQFNSVRRPIIILATIPLGMIGVSFGLLAARSSMGFFTLLGIISLAGIIINNAIVLLDRIKMEEEELGKPPQQAILAACQQRLRPILLTTATTVLGMMPLWWGGTAMFKPMAVTIIFGLAFATVLTLFVVPVLYAALFRVSFKDSSAA
ncbi:MAG: efflux RND transporter permease subunit [Deltaproteobacteria bacterium]|nr:efflux RND transporter permease subunit [Deltaproteobacteria bacterium]